MNLVNKGIFVIGLLLLIHPVHTTYATDKKAPDLSLKNFDGRTVTLQELNGKVVVLTFSYAFCSVRCPVITARLHSLDDVMNTPQDVVYLHVSVDPDMDTPERRLKYFSLYGIDATKDKRWMFVSGKKDALKKLWTSYGVDIDRIEDKRIPEGYYMEYTPKVVIMDKNGFIMFETDYFFSENEIAQKIRRLK